MSETHAPEPGSPTDDRTALESLVDEWLTLPDVAEALGIELSKARRLVSERTLVGIKRGERNTFQVPAVFVITDDGKPHVLSTLRGTVTLLSDAALDDAAILRWLFETEPTIGRPPVEDLLAGRRGEVRRVAQAML